MSISFERRTRLLFVGDSITSSDHQQDRERMGQGYVRLVRDYLLAADPMNAPHVMNVGVAGNRVIDLPGRWDRDVIAPRPDVISISVGVNDVWRGLESGDGAVPADEFAAVYHQILEKTRHLMPACQIVLCEPTGIWPPAHSNGPEFMQPYVDAVHRVGKAFHADAIIPLHSAFVMAHKQRPDVDWTTDGVHPTTTGHMLIAHTWLETTRNLTKVD